MEDDSSAIISLATVRLQAKSRLFLTACCPDKDLVVLVSRVGSADKMSLWKMQGSKKWEVDTNKGCSSSDEVTALNWSPDGQTIVVAHYPPRISLHSLQNGREEHSLLVGSLPCGSPSSPRITGVWWFKRETKTDSKAMPDMLKRGNVVPGSALSIIRTQPLLDALQDDTVPLNATDLFAFQGSHARPGAKVSSLPDVISSWPALPSDPLAAGINPASRESDKRPGDELDEKDTTNVDSLLVAIDDSGQIHCFLDGSYPVGAISLGTGCEAKTIIKNNEENTLLAHAEFKSKDTRTPVLHNVSPLTVELPLLYAKATRHVAENCTAARELAWYSIRVVKEMRKSWFGGDGQVGARDFNTKYARGLIERQVAHGQEKNVVLDLTVLLATGKSSHALSDYHQSGELTSERGLQKWETTVGEALLKLRDYAETRIAPACQHLHLLLEEVRGWSLLPQLHGDYGFSTKEVDECLDLTARAIILAAFLAATARRELTRFVEFIVFLRYETSRLSTPEATPSPRHDILEVNEYLMSGLEKSEIDEWFTGPVPQFSMSSIESTPQMGDLRSVIERARAFLADPSKLTWPPITQRKDLSRLDRNLDALIHELAEKCQEVYSRAAKAVARTASVQQTWTTSGQIQEVAETNGERVVNPTSSQPVRTRAICEEKTNTLTEHLAIRLQEREHGLPRCRELLCIIRASYEHVGSSRTVSGVAAAILDCRSAEDSPDDDTGIEGLCFHIFDMDFFDEESLVIVYQSYAEEGAARIGTVDYSVLEYFEIDLAGYVNGLWQEDIVAEAIARVSAGQAGCPAAPIRKQRTLKLSRSARTEASEGEGIPSVAVNGRVGRRIGCVLDRSGMELEMLDLEGEDGTEGEEEE
ncbi:uncharacterized protein FOMMEDRAFT_167218 [Fomitiporia mediterranea MF3/22]|uniref:uncharacterized protein n=1 Tax=Fomitiporia mediterranea (strain MF3/22) TaxID=694068 RepID=UPI0004408EDD|nr:uncharacterized protein FOMMEDRAFT_167218 [Fomitiporia mediterranea MF3/22]EJD03914.1 hypothetical protein FOMMEDRAFT_167218 [Fomitiporia mediterranea MF3/22]